MERIEVQQPADIYYVASNGKRFREESVCSRYEYLIGKYMTNSRHRIIEDGEGKEQHFFFAKDITEAEEIGELSRWIVGYVCGPDKDRLWVLCWVWLPYDEYPDQIPPKMGKISDFIDLQKECEKAYADTIAEAERLKYSIWQES